MATTLRTEALKAKQTKTESAYTAGALLKKKETALSCHFKRSESCTNLQTKQLRSDLFTEKHEGDARLSQFK